MSQPFVGEIRIWPVNFAPVGWAFCQGQLLPIAENDVLFNLIGTTYGGDGQENFALPNLQSRLPIHMGTAPSGTTYNIGEMSGIENVTLTTNQIPSHSHSVATVAQAANVSIPAGNVVLSNESIGLANANTFTYLPFAAASQTTLAPVTVQSAGGNAPHSNIQPYLALNFIIALFGIFPPHP